jgi:hypothetical protein
MRDARSRVALSDQPRRAKTRGAAIDGLEEADHDRQHGPFSGEVNRDMAGSMVARWNDSFRSLAARSLHDRLDAR